MVRLEEIYYREMLENYKEMETNGELKHKKIYLFGHCNATEKLADLLLENGYIIDAILDNNIAKHGRAYRGIPITAPDFVQRENSGQSIVCIVTRFYEAMQSQLRKLGYTGKIRKLVDYNTYAEYSLSDETLRRKRKRVEYGIGIIEDLDRKYPGHFRVFCPFSALGDVYFCMSYLARFMEKKKKKDYIICVAGNACARVVKLFDDCPVEVLAQKDLEAAIQAELYLEDENSFIAHQDRPYVVNLSKALYQKKIPLETIYCCGVFGLPWGTEPFAPKHWKIYKDIDSIAQGHAVVLSPYAKSVTALHAEVWRDIVNDYSEQGYQIYTNVTGQEQPLEGTIPISPNINEMKSVVERAGTFIGIRSGICDVIRTTDCRKIALYPDYNYCDTQWKAIDIYAIEGFENIVVRDNFIWKRK